MEGRRRRSFTGDYKRQAVDLVASSGRSVGSVAKEPGLRDSVLRRWVERRGAGREATAASLPPTTQATLPSADHAAEIARLQRENDRRRVRGALQSFAASSAGGRSHLFDPAHRDAKIARFQLRQKSGPTTRDTFRTTRAGPNQTCDGVCELAANRSCPLLRTTTVRNRSSDRIRNAHMGNHSGRWRR